MEYPVSTGQLRENMNTVRIDRRRNEYFFTFTVNNSKSICSNIKITQRIDSSHIWQRRDLEKLAGKVGLFAYLREIRKGDEAGDDAWLCRIGW